MTNKLAVKRSSVPDIRKTMLEKGALLFKFEQPTGRSADHVNWFRQMEALGFLVTTSGCIFPYDNFSSSSKGRPKGHKLSAHIFLGKPPVFGRDVNGWPVATQVSHRCHRKSCINPSHLVYEPQWKNLKRNYCGENLKCDCGVTPPCLSTYHNDVWVYSDQYVTYDTTDFKKVVSSFIPGQRFAILSRLHYNSVDTKKKLRNARIKKSSTDKKNAAMLKSSVRPENKS